MWKKKEYIKSITEVIIVDTWYQMLSGSGNSILHKANTQTDIEGPGIGGDEYTDGDGDIDDA